MKNKIELKNSNNYYILINKFLKNKSNYFNSIEYFKNQPGFKNGFYFQLIRKKDNCPIASFSLIKKKDVFFSPLKGTFGGPNFISGNINYNIIEEFLIKCLGFIDNQNPLNIQIKLPPLFHDVNLISIYLNIFLNNGFKIDNQEINYQILVDNIDYNKKINSTKKKILNRSLKKNFEFKQMSQDKLKEAYSIIKKNRENKKYKLSMNFSDLKKIFLLFKNNFKLFGVFSELQLIASAFCIRLDKDIFYIFYWAEDENFTNYSPLVFMSSGIYNYCYENGYKILDLGSASIKGVPNYGLVNYKESLGYSASIKFTLKKTNKKLQFKKVL